jgi:hypothetical protein
MSMVASAVTKLERRGGRLLLTGHVRRDEIHGPPPPIALRLSGKTVCQTALVCEGALKPNVWSFRFVLAPDLEGVLAERSDVSVVVGAAEIPFADAARAARSTLAEAPGRVEDVLAKLSDGFVLTSHGDLSEPLASRGSGLGAILDHYERCDELAHEILGVRLHVVGGTLLGAAREGGCLAHDVDFDAAYLSGARDAEALRVEFLCFLRELARRGENVRLVNKNGQIRRRHFKWRSRPATRGDAGPAHIDVFPAYIDREGFYCRPTFVRIPDGERLVLPLRRAAFSGREVWAPARMEEKAAAVFGEGWRTPDPFWRKPKFPGIEAALAGLRLGDDELLQLAAAMPARPAEELRSALSGQRTADKAAP